MSITLGVSARQVVDRGDNGGQEPARRIVAVVLTHGDGMCLLRRSSLVGSDRGLWHCITGYLEPDQDPDRQALDELIEETGQSASDLRSFQPTGVLTLPDGRTGTWQVMVYRAETRRRTVRLNWENDHVAWTRWDAAQSRFDLVPWLDDVMISVHTGRAATGLSLSGNAPTTRSSRG